jgi:predicted GNAT family acetyltransferase
MAAVTVERTDSPSDALAAAGSHLATDPVRHNLVLTLLQSRAAHPEPGRYWVVRESDRPAGLVLQSPLEFAATTTPMAAAAIAGAVDAIASAGVRLPGVTGEALTAARFAGQWTERTGTGAWPVQGQRIYEVDEIVAPPSPGGRVRVATEEDLELVTRWFEAFEDEIGERRGDLAPLVARRLGAGRLWLWEHDRPAAMAAVSDPVEGVARIGPVYTPPDQRGRGYGSALVGAVSATVRAPGTRCILYTDLGNPTANSVYRRLGYRAVTEALRYRFDQPA